MAILETGARPAFAPSDLDRQRAKSAFSELIPQLFLFFCFFPYLALIPLPMDTQPYALLMSVFVCASVNLKGLSTLVWLLAIAPCVSVVAWLIDDQSFYGLRETLSILSPFFITLATIEILRSPGGKDLLKRYFIFSVYSWLLVGLIETFFDPRLFVAFLSATHLDQARGVAGLATEPSFYGEYCIFLLMFNYLWNQNSKWIMALLLFQVFFLAQSGITILLLLSFLLYRTLLFPRWRVIIGILVFLLVGALAFVYVLPQFQYLRVASLVLSLATHPMDLVQVDASVNARVGHILFSILGFFDNYGLPRGFDHFNDYIASKVNSINFLWIAGTSPHMKILSGYGAGLFELGVFGMIAPLVGLIASIRYFKGTNLRMGIALGLFLTTVMFSAGSISLPLYGLLLGWLIMRPNEVAENPLPAR